MPVIVQPGWIALLIRFDFPDIIQNYLMRSLTLAVSIFTPGPKGEANKWVTLYAYLALQHRDSRARAGN